MLTGKELKNFRNRRKLTVREVAAHAGLAISTISDIENGKLNVTEGNHKALVNGINKAFFEKVKQEAEKEKKSSKAQKESSADNSEGDLGDGDSAR
jgi:Transcriptional regulators